MFKLKILLACAVIAISILHAEITMGSTADLPIKKITDTLHMSSPVSQIGLEKLDSVVPDYNVFIIGENHVFMNSNTALWNKMIRYLYQHAGVRTVMIEYGNATAWIIDQYIQTGDSSYMKILDDYAFEEYANSYRELRKFNETLPDDDKIHVIGVDLERGIYTAVKALSLHLPKDKNPHDSIELSVESLIGLAAYQDRELFNSDEENASRYYFGSYSVTNTLDLIIEDFNHFSSYYQNYLDSNYEFFATTIKALEDVKYWHQLGAKNTIQDYVYREKYIYKRFEQEYLKRGGKFFGMFGRCHSTTNLTEENGCNWYQFKSFANRVKQSDTLDLKDKLLTIGVLYEMEDGFVSNGLLKNAGPDEIEAEKHLKDLFEKMPKKRVALYDLSADSVLAKSFENDFRFLILNTTLPSFDHPYMAGKSESIETKFGYAMGFYRMDFKSLNSVVKGLDGKTFKDQVRWNIFEASTEEYSSSPYVSLNQVGFVHSQNLTLDYTDAHKSTAKFSGFMINSYGLYHLLRRTSWIDFYPGLMIGYTQLKLQINQTKTTGVPDPSNGFIGNQSVAYYQNPGITWGGAAILDLNFGPVYLGGMFGFQRDWSKTPWITNNARISGGPRTKLNSVYYTLRAGFRISDY
ncbi:MAG: hypothetical protein GC181_16215 [Bacteroidetes bacterium]|nr:hypothetical protein [Bacteroidota bacterium]